MRMTVDLFDALHCANPLHVSDQRPSCQSIAELAAVWPLPPRGRVRTTLLEYMRIVTLIAFAATLAAAQENPAARAARQWRQQHERSIVDEFFTLLAIPDIARDKENIQRNAETIAH